MRTVAGDVNGARSASVAEPWSGRSMTAGQALLGPSSTITSGERQHTIPLPGHCARLSSASSESIMTGVSAMRGRPSRLHTGFGLHPSKQM